MLVLGYESDHCRLGPMTTAPGPVRPRFQVCALTSMTMRPVGLPPTLMSKKTLGFPISAKLRAGAAKIWWARRAAVGVALTADASEASERPSIDSSLPAPPRFRQHQPVPPAIGCLKASTPIGRPQLRALTAPPPHSTSPRRRLREISTSLPAPRRENACTSSPSWRCNSNPAPPCPKHPLPPYACKKTGASKYGSPGRWEVSTKRFANSKTG